MKKFSILLCALMFGAATFAQKPVKNPHKIEDRVRKITDKMKAELALSPDQETKVYALNLDMAKKRKSIKMDNNIDSAQKKMQLMAIRKNYKEELKKVLTPEQVTILKERAKERHKQKKNAGVQPPNVKPSNPGKGPDLSDDDIEELVD